MQLPRRPAVVCSKAGLRSHQKTAGTALLSVWHHKDRRRTVMIQGSYGRAATVSTSSAQCSDYSPASKVTTNQACPQLTGIAKCPSHAKKGPHKQPLCNAGSLQDITNALRLHPVESRTHASLINHFQRQPPRQNQHHCSPSQILKPAFLDQDIVLNPHTTDFPVTLQHLLINHAFPHPILQLLFEWELPEIDAWLIRDHSAGRQCPTNPQVSEEIDRW